VSQPEPTPELRARLDAVVDALGLRVADDPRVDAQVAALCARMTEPSVWEGTDDERHLAYVTIDNPGSRDLDQALHVARDGDSFVVSYAVADAAYFVPVDDSPLWRRALAQGSSFYLPAGGIPMLPAPLSEGIVSLNPAVERRALRFRMVVADDGTCVAVDARRVRMRSRAKLSYVGVQAYRDGVATSESQRVRAAARDVEVADSLAAFFELGERLVAAAEARDATPVDRVEAEVDVDPDAPGRLRVLARERNAIERYNEQISLLFNIQGAELLGRYSASSEEVQAVFRVHLPPLAERLDALSGVLGALAARRGLGERWRWARGGGADLGAFVRALPDEATTARMRHAVLRQVRHTFRSSSFRARSGPHHALGVDGYARLSAPMREAVGIFTHKELLEGLGLAAPRDAAADAVTRELVIASANEARQKQRALDKAIDMVVIEQLLHDDLLTPPEQRPWRSGTIVGLRTTRIYVALDGFAIDLKVYRQDLEASAHEGLQLVDDVAFVGSASGEERFALGDGVALRVARWDADRARYALECRREPAG
jgi:ribonuclease R